MARIWTEQLPSGKWRAGWRKHGKKMRAPGTYDRKRDAVAAAEEWLESGSPDPSSSRLRFADFAEDYIGSRISLADSTMRSKELHYLDKHLLPKWGEYPLGEITMDDVEAWVVELSTKLGPWGQRDCYGVFRRVMLKAQEKRYVRYSPLPLKPEFVPIEQQERAYLSDPADVWALADAIELRYRTLVLTMAFMGLRPGEAFGIRERYVRTEGDDPGIFINGVVTEPAGTAPYYRASTKTKRKAFKPMPAFLVPEWEAQLSERKHPDTDFCFTSLTGKLIRRSNFQRRYFNPAVRAAGLDPRLVPYSLRHTTGVLLMELGYTDRERAEWVGHSVRMQSETYGHVSSERMRQIAAALDQAAGNNRETADLHPAEVRVSGSRRGTNVGQNPKVVDLRDRLKSASDQGKRTRQSR